MKLGKLFFPILNFIALVVLPLALNYYITSNYGELLDLLEELTNIRIQSTVMFIIVIGIMLTVLSIAKSFSNRTSFVNLISSLGMSLLWFLLLSFIVSFGKGLFGISTFYIKPTPTTPLSESIIVEFNFSFTWTLLVFSLILSMLADLLTFHEERKKTSVSTIQ